MVKNWPFGTRCEQNRHFGRFLSCSGVVNSSKTHLGDVALILLYLPDNFPCLWLNINVSINVVRWVFKSGHYTCPFLRQRYWWQKACVCCSVSKSRLDFCLGTTRTHGRNIDDGKCVCVMQRVVVTNGFLSWRHSNTRQRYRSLKACSLQGVAVTSGLLSWRHSNVRQRYFLCKNFDDSFAWDCVKAKENL